MELGHYLLMNYIENYNFDIFSSISENEATLAAIFIMDLKISILVSDIIMSFNTCGISPKSFKKSRIDCFKSLWHSYLSK